MAQAPLTTPALTNMNNDVRIVILGKTGTGKSETGNSILGEPEFECSPGGNISTWNCMKKIKIRFNKHILVIDTPGLQDNETQSHDTRSEIRNSIQMAYHVARAAKAGPNVFLLCLKMGRFTAEDETLFKECLVCFGEQMFPFTIIVFTHEDIWETNMKYAGKTADHREYMQSLPLFAKEFIGKCRAKIFFNNRKTGSDMDLQVQTLFKEIDDMMDFNSGNIYTTEMLRQVLNREKRQNYMNYLNGTIILNSILAIGNVLFFRYLRR